MSDDKQDVVCPEGSTIIVCIIYSDKCPGASTFCYVPPELSFSTVVTYIAVHKQTTKVLIK